MRIHVAYMDIQCSSNYHQIWTDDMQKLHLWTESLNMWEIKDFPFFIRKKNHKIRWHSFIRLFITFDVLCSSECKNFGINFIIQKYSMSANIWWILKWDCQLRKKKTQLLYYVFCVHVYGVITIKSFVFFFKIYNYYVIHVIRMLYAYNFRN